jgi:transcriptional regulator with GAF, ATPase, and Fis domain
VSVPAGLHAELAAVSRALQHEPDTQHTLERSVRIATTLIAGCDYAGISIVHRDGTIDTPAASDDMVAQADRYQYEFNEGPCLDAIWHHDTVTSPNLLEEKRWPQWAPKVSSDFGMQSMLCLQLFTSADVVGGLNLYSLAVDGFDADDVDTATYLAAHMAVAVAVTQHADDLRIGALNRTVIGQAQGILMERFGLDASQAFDALRRVSQDRGVKLITVAGDLVSNARTSGS